MSEAVARAGKPPAASEASGARASLCRCPQQELLDALEYGIGFGHASRADRAAGQPALFGADELIPGLPQPGGILIG